jgi:cellulose synthase/poly-beta-1,6-N-acetylglucosamine synthase-like glycosyltransferase
MNLLFLFYFILLVYLFFVIWILRGLPKSKVDLKAQDDKPQTRFSIIIPMRNEAENLPQLLHSISELSYPHHLLELFFIDDDSEDESWSLVRVFQSIHRTIPVFLLSNSVENSEKDTFETTYTPKKRAIHRAVSLASCPYIITTDADVILPQLWLESYDAKIQVTNADLIAGGVVVAKANTFLSHYQHYDMLSLQLFGYGSYERNQPVICNGANLCYKKASYIQADVHRGKENIASGDDVFTLQKFRALGHRIEYLYDPRSLVWTSAVNSFEALLQQRRRWTKKSTAVDSLYFKGVGVLVMLMQLSLVISVIFSVFNTVYLGFLINAFILKFCVDAWSLKRMAKLQSLEICWIEFLKVSLVYPFFTLMFAASSLYGKFDWKGRRYSK